MAFIPSKKDIDEQAYLRYEGEFFVEEYYRPYRSSEYVRISHDGKEVVRYKVLCDMGDVQNSTTCLGWFVYSQNSNSLVEFHIEKVLDQPQEDPKWKK